MLKYIAIIGFTCILTFLVICIIFFNSSNKLIGEKIVFKSENGEFVFEAIPSKGRDYKMMERAFSEYKYKNDLNEDLRVYRVTKKNYLRISQWCSYKNFPEWHYPLHK